MDIRLLEIDEDYLRDVLLNLLEIPSPSGFTDTAVHWACDELSRLGIEYELTRRGAIRATIKGRHRRPNRALVAHLDTLGAMVTDLKPDGRLSIAPVGTWSARFAEGARVTIFTDDPQVRVRGTILPAKASGHIFDEEIDTQPVGWDHVEVRVDRPVRTNGELFELGVRVGDYVSIDPQPEFTEHGFIVSRHLDDKAGVACMLSAAQAVLLQQISLPVDTHLLLTIHEEVGSGASATLHQDVAEMVAIDNATPGPGQAASEYDVTIAMMDSSGPFDYHLSRKLLRLARDYDLYHARDVLRYYRCDAAAAVESGNDIRAALLGFGVDASHGYERTHISSLLGLTQLLGLYMQSEPVTRRDRMELGPITGFTDQPTEAPPVPEKRAGPQA